MDVSQFLTGLTITPFATDHGNFLRLEAAGLEGLQLHVRAEAAIALLQAMGMALSELPETDTEQAAIDAGAELVARRAAKRMAVENMLKSGSITIRVDLTHDGVMIPDAVRARYGEDCGLRFGYNLRPPIDDLTIDADGISATLAFGGQPGLVVIPWDAIFVVVLEGAQSGLAWPDDMPPSVRARIAAGIVPPGTDAAAKAEAEAAAKPRPKLGVIQGGLEITQHKSTPTPEALAMVEHHRVPGPILHIAPGSISYTDGIDQHDEDTCEGCEAIAENFSPRPPATACGHIDDCPLCECHAVEDEGGTFTGRAVPDEVTGIDEDPRIVGYERAALHAKLDEVARTAPPGWRCSRMRNHEGPCAAIPHEPSGPPDYPDECGCTWDNPCETHGPHH